MSTYYRELQNPLTSIRVEGTGPHKTISLWAHGAKIGMLTVSAGDEADDVVRMFFGEEVCVVTAAGDGKTRLTVLVDRQPRATLLSEYGEIVSFEQLDSAADLKERP